MGSFQAVSSSMGASEVVFEDQLLASKGDGAPPSCSSSLVILIVYVLLDAWLVAMLCGVWCGGFAWRGRDPVQGLAHGGLGLSPCFRSLLPPSFAGFAAAMRMPFFVHFSMTEVRFFLGSSVQGAMVAEDVSVQEIDSGSSLKGAGCGEDVWAQELDPERSLTGRIFLKLYVRRCWTQKAL